MVYLPCKLTDGVLWLVSQKSSKREVLNHGMCQSHPKKLVKIQIPRSLPVTYQIEISVNRAQESVFSPKSSGHLDISTQFSKLYFKSQQGDEICLRVHSQLAIYF